MLFGCHASGNYTKKDSLTDSSPKSDDATEHSRTLFAMDTVMELTVYGDATLLDNMEELIIHLEQLFSVTNAESDIAKINRGEIQTLNTETEALLRRSLELCKQTNGTLDISIYPVVRAWGFTTGQYRVPSEEELSALLQKVDYRSVQIGTDGLVSLDEGMEIDFGSVAKGYTGNRLIALLRENGVSSAKINLGGNVHMLGSKPDGTPWRIAIADPSGSGYAGALSVRDKAVITSGGYERYFEQDGVVYPHIINPQTGMPVKNDLLSVTIIGSDGTICDAYSTALFVMGLDDAVRFWKENGDFEAIFITSEKEIYITEGIEDTFSPYGAYKNAKVTVIRND